MQVDALTGNIRTEQHPQRLLRLAKLLDNLLLIDVTHAAMELGDLVGLEFQVLCQLGFEKFQGFDSFGEYHQPVLGIALLPCEITATYQLHKALIF